MERLLASLLKVVVVVVVLVVVVVVRMLGLGSGSSSSPSIDQPIAVTCPRSILNQMSSMLRFPQLLSRFIVRGMSDCSFRSVVPPSSSGEDMLLRWLVAFLA
jgi:hypothetical protein